MRFSAVTAMGRRRRDRNRARSARSRRRGRSVPARQARSVPARRARSVSGPPSALAGHPRPRRMGDVRRGLSRVKRLGRRRRRERRRRRRSRARRSRRRRRRRRRFARRTRTRSRARVFRRCRRSFAISSRRRGVPGGRGERTSRVGGRGGGVRALRVRGDLTRAQTRLPPFVTAVVGERGTTRARTFADAWLDACGRAGGEARTRVALTQ